MQITRPDLFQHLAVGGQITGLSLLPLHPQGVPLGVALGIGLLLTVVAAIARELYSRLTGRGTADPADLAATVGGGLLVALVALSTI